MHVTRVASGGAGAIRRSRNGHRLEKVHRRRGGTARLRRAAGACCGGAEAGEQQRSIRMDAARRVRALPIYSQAGLDLWGVRENRTKMHRTASTASRTGCSSRISTEIRLILTPIVDGMLGHRSGMCATATAAEAINNRSINTCSIEYHTDCG